MGAGGKAVAPATCKIFRINLVGKEVLFKAGFEGRQKKLNGFKSPIFKTPESDQDLKGDQVERQDHE